MNTRTVDPADMACAGDPDAFAADHAYAEERPALREGVSWHAYGKRDPRTEMFVLRSARDGQYVLTSKVGIEVIQLMDGKRGIREIARQVRETYGARLPEDRIAQFIDVCAANDLIEPGTWASGRTIDIPKGLRREKLGFYSKVYNADELLDLILDYRRWWLNPITKCLGFVAMLLGAYNLFVIPEGGGVLAPLKQMDMSYTDMFLLALPLAFVVELALHELGHALSCRLMGARPKGFGFGLLWGVIPIVYTDTTDAYTIPSRAKRIFVSFAGPMVDLMCFGAVMTAYWLVEPGSLAAKLLLAYSALPLTSILISLNPFYLRMDGYWMLADWLRMPNLRRESMHYLKSLFTQRAALPGSPLPPVLRRMIYVGYVLVAVAWTVGFAMYVSVEGALTIYSTMQDFFGQSIYL